MRGLKNKAGKKWVPGPWRCSQTSRNQLRTWWTFDSPESGLYWIEWQKSPSPLATIISAERPGIFYLEKRVWRYEYDDGAGNKYHGEIQHPHEIEEALESWYNSGQSNHIVPL